MLFIGDLHISDRFSARHKNYLQLCIDFLQDVTKSIEENKVTHLFLTGDLVGRTTEKNFQSRQTLLYFIKVLQNWNDLTNGNVYTLRGNHDIGKSLTDFDFLVSIGLLKLADYVDVGSVRVHLLNYGEHNRQISVDKDKYNIALTHADIHVEGLTTWFYRSKEAVELAYMENLYGVDMVIGGHIHTPSEKIVETMIRDKPIQLVYPGNGTRPKLEKRLWNHCFGILVDSTDEDVSVGSILYELPDYHEVFEFLDVEVGEDGLIVDDSPTFSIEELSDILETLKNYNLVGDTGYKAQLIKLGGLDKEAVDLALAYIEKVEEELK